MPLTIPQLSAFQLPQSLPLQQVQVGPYSQEQPVSLGSIPGYQQWWQKYLQQMAAQQQQNAQQLHQLGPFNNALSAAPPANSHMMALMNYMQGNPMGSYAPPDSSLG
jgi:hypothetical protein